MMITADSLMRSLQDCGDDAAKLRELIQQVICCLEIREQRMSEMKRRMEYLKDLADERR